MSQLLEDHVRLPSGLRLATRHAEGPRRAFLLVHGLASNARLWDGTALQLASAGHRVIAVDQRGHGRSDEPPAGYDTQTCADDLAALCEVLDLTGDHAPIVAGQSWGGNVVLTLAAKHQAAAAIALLDGGWLRLRAKFETFEQCWERLAPPDFGGMSMSDLSARVLNHHRGWPPETRTSALGNFVETPDGGVRARLSREHHESILRSMWQGDPRELFPLVDVPVLLMPAAGPDDADPEVRNALQAIPRADVRWYAGADHDLHAQQPSRVAADLLEFAAAAGLS
ncbi:MAG TPA: alpha/beta hydrolase [Acidothermaceae bacterium]|jgi:pimeloyl-ACP methyl ester carboxylesterase